MIFFRCPVLGFIGELHEKSSPQLLLKSGKTFGYKGFGRARVLFEQVEKRGIKSCNLTPPCMIIRMVDFRAVE